MINFEKYLKYQKNEIEKTSGFLIYNKSTKKFLLCKGYNSNYWTIPKGHQNKNENLLQTAYRETLEETGLNLKNIDGQIKYIGNGKNNTGKKELHVYLFISNQNISNIKLNCKTFFDNKKPEISNYKWIKSFNIKNYINPYQYNIIKNYLK